MSFSLSAVSGAWHTSLMYTAIHMRQKSSSDILYWTLLSLVNTVQRQKREHFLLSRLVPSTECEENLSACLGQPGIEVVRAGLGTHLNCLDLHGHVACKGMEWIEHTLTLYDKTYILNTSRCGGQGRVKIAPRFSASPPSHGMQKIGTDENMH